MKNINFIKSLPQYRQQELRRWFYLSCTLAICLGAIVAYVQINQIQQLQHEYATCKNAKKCIQCDTIMAEKNRLKQQEQLLQKQIAKIEKITKGYSNFDTLLKTVHNLFKAPLYLEFLSFSGNTFEITARGPDVQTIMHLVQQLNKIEYIAHSEIISLRQKDHVILFSLKAKIG